VGIIGKIIGSVISKRASTQAIVFYEKNIPHIFRNAPGHLPDTPANRKLILDVASNRKNYYGKDMFGNEWYALRRSDGSQVWAQVRNGQIRNGGLNPTPRPWNPQTGFSYPRNTGGR
jgi:N-acetylneuraminic acid mutarotase